MNFKLTLGLAIVLLLAALGFMFAKRGADVPKSTADSTPFFQTAPQDINSITLLRGGSVELKFVKDGDAWKMTDPVKASVEPYAITTVATSLKTLSYLRKFEPETTGDKTPEATGTAKPRDILKFTDDKGKEHTLALGKRSTDGTFATFDGGSTVYVLQANPVVQLDKRPDEFRNKQIKTVDTSKITRLDVKTDKGETHLTKTDGKWMITSPAARANSAAVEDIIKEFANIQALTFATLKKAQVGVDPGVVTVTAWIDDAPPTTSTAPATVAASQSQPSKSTAVTLQLGYFSDVLHKEASPVYASVSGNDDVFTYSHDAFTKLNKDLKDLRDPAILPNTVAITNASDLTLTTDGTQTLAAAHKDNKWTLTSTTPPLSGDPYALSDYLGLIRDLRTINYVDNPGDLKSIGLDPPHMKIELAIPGQSQHEVLLIGKSDTDPNGGKVTALMRQGEPTVYQVQTADADRLATTILALRDKQVETLVADQIRKIEITGTDATPGITPPSPATSPDTAPATAASAPALKPGVTLVRNGTVWSIEKDGTTLAADESKISALLGDFTPLMATKYLDQKPPQGTPAITLTVSLLESALPATKPAPAAATAPATTAATTTAPTTSLAEILPAPGGATVDPGKITTHTITLYKVDAAATSPTPPPATGTAPASQPTSTWKAAWDGQVPAWSFEPTPSLLEHLIKTTYNPGPAASQPATKPFAMP